MIVAKYKFNPSTYADLLPEFNSGFSYTKSDVTNSDGTITRTINSDSLPTLMTFGTGDETYNRSGSLLEILDMNTSNLTSMQRMFRYCINLTNITCNWNTSKVTIMRDAFQKCTSLTSLNLSRLDTSKVTDMTSMFNGSSNLTSLDLNNWDTSKVTNMTAMFLDCSSLTSLGIGDWNTSNVTNLNSAFKNCSSLTSLDLNSWNTSKVTDMQYLFGDCSSLSQLNINNWNTIKVTSTNNMFRNCTSLTSVNLIGWDTINLTNMSAMFYNCSSLTSVNLNSFNTSKVTNMSYMFQNCSSLTSIVIDTLDVSQVTTMMNMFFNCSSLTSLDLSNWNTSKLTNMSYMFNGCDKLTSLDISNWNTSRLTTTNYMFNGCSSLTSLDLSNWNTSKITNMGYMFSSCTSLTTLDLSNWHVSESTSTFGFFVGSMPNFYKVNLKYADEYTVSKIVTDFPNRTNTTPGYVLSSVDFTSNKNWQRIKSSHNNFYLPQPLNKIGDVKDRLYWDENKGHYCIEQNAPKIYLHTLDWVFLPSVDNLPEDEIAYQIANFCQDNNITKPSFNNSMMVQIIKCNVPCLSGTLTDLDEGDVFVYHGSGNIYFKTKKTNIVNDSPIPYLKEKNYFIVVTRPTPNIIDLPHLNQKLTFDSYAPSTTIDIPNSPLKASKTYLDAPIARYRHTNLQPNTQYNVQFDCKGDNGIKVNLGGTETTFTPTSEWTRKNLTITTPSELVNDKLSISNVGITSNNKIDNVMLFSEVIAQEPDYIDGIQNIGELQDNETYKIDILTHNKGFKPIDLVDNSKYAWDTGNLILGEGFRSKDEYIDINILKNKNILVCSNASLPYKEFVIKFYDSNFKVTDKNHSALNKTNISDTKLLLDFKSEIPSDALYFRWCFYSGENYISTYDIKCYYIDKSTTDFSNIYNYIETTQSILLPQPLNKIGDIKDKFYWDDDKGHYCIEQKFSQEKANGLNWIIFNQNDDFIYFRSNQLSNNFKHSDKGLCNKLTCYQQYSLSAMSKEGLSLRGNTMDIVLSKTRGILSIEQLKAFINDLFVIWELEIPQIIDLPHLNKKYSLDTYMPTTYLECTNNPMQPSRLLLESDTVRYKPSVLETDTDYTIQFECKEKSDKKVKLNLGGTEKEVDVEVGLNHVSITTPSEIDTSLYKDRLFLSGVGNKVADVIVNKGEMNQYPSYFNGEQSTGELQDDGTYKIDIETSSEYKEVNIFNSDIYSMEDGTIDISSGINQNYANESRVAQFIPCVANTEYRVEIEISGGYGYICYYYDANKKYLGCNKEANSFYAITEDKFEQVAYVRFRVNKPVGSYNNVKLLGQENTTHKISIISNSPLAKGDKLYWNKSNKRYEIDRGGDIEVPTVSGDVIDLPRLYQREDTHFSTSTGNIKPSKIKLDYNDLD